MKKNSKTVKNAANSETKGAEAGSDAVKGAAQKTKNAISVSQKAMVGVLDQDGNGTIDSADLILMALKVPGVKINREEFLRKEFYKNHSKEQIDLAIATTPAKAGIDKGEINRIADEVIIFERNAVSGISVALGIPGGVAMAATIPADIAQYYGYMLRAAQKLLFLYGFPALDMSEESLKLDSETLNSLTLCLGIMYGVANANNAIKAMAKALASGVEKKLLRTALTKGTIYPIVKSIAKWFSVNMTKEIFAGFFKKAIPVVGGVIGGGLTFVTFKPCCERLKDALKDTMLSNPDHKSSAEEDVIFNNIKNGNDEHEILELKESQHKQGKFDLIRFHTAQKRDYEKALQELRSGKKCTHWMWYIFPQLKGLGQSDMANHYGIKSIDEAKAYLADPVLRNRLVEISNVLLTLEENDPKVIFGSPNHMKLRSCMTLFSLVDPEEEVFRKVLDKFFNGEMDKKTLMLLNR